MLIFEDVDSYKMAQVINQSWTEPEDLVIGPAGGRNVQQITQSDLESYGLSVALQTWVLVKRG